MASRGLAGNGNGKWAPSYVPHASQAPTGSLLGLTLFLFSLLILSHAFVTTAVEAGLKLLR